MIQNIDDIGFFNNFDVTLSSSTPTMSNTIIHTWEEN